MEQVTVLGVWMSPFCMRPLIALQERGVQYENQEEVLPYNKSDLLLQMNPVYKKVPVLIHNGKPICESLIILQYIDETCGSQKVSSYDRALARFWVDFVDKKFCEAWGLVLRSKDKDQEQAKRDMLQNFKLLEGALNEMSAGGSLPFFGGEEFGLLDIAFIPFACWFQAYETIGNFKISFETEYPLLDAWVKRCMERESVKKILPSSDRILGVGIYGRLNCVSLMLRKLYFMLSY